MKTLGKTGKHEKVLYVAIKQIWYGKWELIILTFEACTFRKKSLHSYTI